MTAAQHEKLMRMLVGENCYMDWVIRQQPTTSSSAAALASYAEDYLTCAVRCLMVGMEHEALELLAKSNQWMTKALIRAEAGEVIELEYHRHFCHAVCRWLLGTPALSHDLTRACELLSKSEATLHTASGSTFHLDLTVPFWLFAGRYTDCITTYEQSGAKYPATRKRRYSEAAMACMLANERLHPTMTEKYRTKWQQTFLLEQVPTFLNSGRDDRFGMWVKVITNADAGEAARSAVRQIAFQYA